MPESKVTILKGDREMTVSPDRAASLVARGWTVKPAPEPATKPKA